MAVCQALLWNVLGFLDIKDLLGYNIVLFCGMYWASWISPLLGYQDSFAVIYWALLRNILGSLDIKAFGYQGFFAVIYQALMRNVLDSLEINTFRVSWLFCCDILGVFAECTGLFGCQRCYDVKALLVPRYCGLFCEMCWALWMSTLFYGLLRRLPCVDAALSLPTQLQYGGLFYGMD